MSALLGLSSAYDSDASSSSDESANAPRPAMPPPTSADDRESRADTTETASTLFASLPAANDVGEKKKRKKKKKKRRHDDDGTSGKVSIQAKVQIDAVNSNGRSTGPGIARDAGEDNTGKGGKGASGAASWLPAPQHESLDDMLYRTRKAKEAEAAAAALVEQANEAEGGEEATVARPSGKYASMFDNPAPQPEVEVPADSYNYPVGYTGPVAVGNTAAVTASLPAVPGEFQGGGGRKRRRGDFPDLSQIKEIRQDDIRGFDQPLPTDAMIAPAAGPQNFSASSADIAANMRTGSKGKRKNQLTHLAASAVAREKAQAEQKLQAQAMRRETRGKYGW